MSSAAAGGALLLAGLAAFLFNGGGRHPVLHSSAEPW